MYFNDINKDMEMLQKKTGLFVTYLEKETDLEESMCYTYQTQDIESSDDVVDISQVNFLLNVYLQNNLNERKNLIYKSLSDLGFVDIKLIDTVKEESCYNTAFIFLKNYNTRGNN